MGFGDHYINVFTVLRTLGLLSHLPVTLTTGQQVVPLKVIKALLPDPQTLAPGYTGNTCIGNFVKGWKDGKKREMLIYQVSDHKQCFEEVESQGISYTAGVPPVAAAMLVAQGIWDPKTMVNVEELDPEPVSYTHLDVYKRQVLQNPALIGAEQEIWLLASADVDTLVKGNIDRLSLIHT